MKILDVAICVNNTDPKGIGRIRYRPYGTYTSELKGGISYENWDENDPFIAIPFLPLHINIIPQIQQSIKLIAFDSAHFFQNVQYIAGPHTSPHNLQDQTYSAQHKGTVFGGIIVKGLKDIRNQDGTFNYPVTKGTMINDRDTGFRGNYGSDLIFSENGVQLRGGMLIDKQTKRQNILDYPQMSKKMGRLSLKKFAKTYQPVETIIDKSQLAISKLKYIVEYEINSLTSPTELKLFVYKVIGGYGMEFNTNIFGETSVFSPTDTTKVKLINTTNSLTDPTYIKSLTGTIQSGHAELNEILRQIDFENLIKLDPSYPNEDIHPFYFRPASEFRLRQGGNPLEVTNKSIFLNKVGIRGKFGGSNLIYSRSYADPPIIPNEQKGIVAQEVKGAGEQSFSNLSADKIYLTSTNPNIGKNVKTINFNELDEYELTQDDYIAKIAPNTYGSVRGENLYNLLIAIINLLNSHKHNINETLVKSDTNWEILMELANSMRDDLLNDSIRIN